MRSFGFKTEEFDYTVLVDGEDVVDLSEWQGLSQTMKRFIDKKHDEMAQIVKTDMTLVS